ncbi:MAG: HD domain-containing protein [Myxococcota bacterium]|nr:HD domain-containing protein [Myxococcota bacterium]MDW8363800.1 HD domain-containing protein [Myxococcales bacterium]
MPTGTPLYGRRLDEAVALALDAFRDRTRKGSRVPYIAHLFQVMVSVAEHGGDEDQLIAAVLHDYLEDIDGSNVVELRERFGARVAQMVESLSDTHEHPKPDWHTRKLMHLERMRGFDAATRLVCAADKLHNARCILADMDREGLAAFDRFNKPAEATLWYYSELVPALGHGWSHPLLDALAEAVRQMRDRAEELGARPASSGSE